MAKILLAEDNEMNRDMLSRRLMRKGYEVVAALPVASPRGPIDAGLGGSGQGRGFPGAFFD